MQTKDGLALAAALEKSASALREEVAEITDDSARQKPGGERWSVLENIEHVSIVDQLLSTRIGSTEPVAEKIVSPAPDSVLFDRVIDRRTAISAPEITHPTGKFISVSDALEHFEQVRAQVIAILVEKEQVLRNVPVRHPFFGTVSGYEGFLLIAAHTHRHVGQIKEIQAARKA